MTKFWELLEESVIIQGLVTLGLVGAVIFLVVTEKAIPEALFGLSSLSLGYYFGSKGQLTGRQAAQSVMRQLVTGEEFQIDVQSNRHT